jgi:hypothetical protein
MNAVFKIYYKSPVYLAFNLHVLNGELRDFCYQNFKNTVFFGIHYLSLLLLIDSLKLRFSYIWLNFDTIQ